LALALPRSRTASAPAATATAEARGIGLADLPDPEGCSEAARRELRAGLLTLRDRGWEAAQHGFDEAAKLDPTCATAQFRRAFVRMDTPPEIEVARDAYHRALSGRDKLSARDGELLDALGLLYAGERPQRSEFAARAVRLAEKYPRDAEIVAMAG